MADPSPEAARAARLTMLANDIEYGTIGSGQDRKTIVADLRAAITASAIEAQRAETAQTKEPNDAGE